MGKADRSTDESGSRRPRCRASSSRCYISKSVSSVPGLVTLLVLPGTSTKIAYHSMKRWLTCRTPADLLKGGTVEDADPRRIRARACGWALGPCTTPRPVVPVPVVKSEVRRVPTDRCQVLRHLPLYTRCTPGLRNQPHRRSIHGSIRIRNEWTLSPKRHELVPPSPPSDLSEPY